MSLPRTRRLLQALWCLCAVALVFMVWQGGLPDGPFVLFLLSVQAAACFYFGILPLVLGAFGPRAVKTKHLLF